jgi:hypothetical protein
MPDLKISQLPLDDAIDGTELVPLAQGSANRRATLAAIRDYVRAGLSVAIGAVTGLQAALDAKAATTDPRLSDARAPLAHKASHASGGSDALTPADIGAAAAAHTHSIANITGLQAALDAKLGTPALATLIDGANIAWNLATQGPAAQVTLAGNRTLANPSGLVAGASYVLIVRQDATGGRTLSYGSAYKWPGGTAPALSTAPGVVDVLTFISDGSVLLGVAAKAFS